MQYLCLIYENEAQQQGRSPEESKEIWDGYMSFNQEIGAAGKLVGGDALEPTSTATSVRLRDGKVLVTDGPFAETREALGGYYLINADDLDDAVRIAAKIPTAKHGTIEVRPVMVLDM